MGQGRGSAGVAVLLGVVVLLSLVARHEAAVYTVGDSGGWTFNMAGWTSGKHFHPGDQLVFKYNPSEHNLVVVDAPGYNNCKPGPGSKVFTSGKDVITLGRGTSYFICSFPGHCEADMKIVVTAA